MNDRFIKFCQEVYDIDKVAGLKLLFDTPYTCRRFSYTNSVSSCFTWSSSIEGVNYWRRIDVLWRSSKIGYDADQWDEEEEDDYEFDEVDYDSDLWD